MSTFFNMSSFFLRKNTDNKSRKSGSFAVYASSNSAVKARSCNSLPGASDAETMEKSPPVPAAK